MNAPCHNHQSSFLNLTEQWRMHQSRHTLLLVLLSPKTGFATHQYMLQVNIQHVPWYHLANFINETTPYGTMGSKLCVYEPYTCTNMTYGNTYHECLWRSLTSQQLVATTRSKKSGQPGPTHPKIYEITDGVRHISTGFPSNLPAGRPHHPSDGSIEQMLSAHEGFKVA